MIYSLLLVPKLGLTFDESGLKNAVIVVRIQQHRLEAIRVVVLESINRWCYMFWLSYKQTILN